jgi:hypothetical protein
MSAKYGSLCSSDFREKTDADNNRCKLMTIPHMDLWMWYENSLDIKLFKFVGFFVNRIRDGRHQVTNFNHRTISKNEKFKMNHTDKMLRIDKVTCLPSMVPFAQVISERKQMLTTIDAN